MLRILRLLMICVGLGYLAPTSQAAVLLSGERLPVALEDGRLRWAEGRYVDPEGTISDYWVAPQALFFTVQTPTATLLKRLEPATGTLNLLMTVPLPGVIRFHPLAAYILMPTSHAWQFIEVPYQAPTPRLICADPIAPHVSAYLSAILLHRGTQLWSLTPTGPLTLLDSDLTEWVPGRDLFDTPDVWAHDSWLFRTIPALMPSGLYRRASGHYYLLDHRLQPIPLSLPSGATLLTLHPDAVVATQYVPIIRTMNETRRIDFWSLRSHQVIPVSSAPTKTPLPDPTEHTLIWGQTPSGTMAAFAHGPVLDEIALDTGTTRTRLTQPSPIQYLDAHLDQEHLWVRPDNGAWYALGESASLPSETEWPPIPTTLPAPTGVSSLLMAPPPTPMTKTEKPTSGDSNESVPVSHPPSRMPEPIVPSMPRPTSPPPLTAPPTGATDDRARSSQPTSAPATTLQLDRTHCFTLASAGTLRAFPESSAPILGRVPPRTIYRQGVVTERQGYRWYQLTLTHSSDPVTGWISAQEITPLGPCQASEPATPPTIVQP